MTIEQRLADICRTIGLRLEFEIEEGRRSNRIDADDLLETLYAIADSLDPQTPAAPAAIDDGD